MKSPVLLLALALGLALGGCKSTPPPAVAAQALTTELRATVADSVKDSARREQMLAVVGQMDAAQADFTRDTTAFVASFRELNARYDAPRSDFDALFKSYEAQRTAARDRFIGAHFQLTTLATADEWKKISKAERKLYEELLKSRPQDEEDAS